MWECRGHTRGCSRVISPVSGAGIRDDSARVSTLLGLLFGIAGMGSSSAAIAVPLIADDLGVGHGAATWTISLYVLMLR